MISVSPIGVDAGEYYASLATKNYYLESGEPPGAWIGEGAGALGLSGEVHANHLHNLILGFSPEGQPLVQNAGKPRRNGYDFTFSAPKSVSVLWGIASEKHRRVIEESHDRAVRRAVRYLEEQAAFCRRGHDGFAWEKATGLVAAKFQHGSSRADDPHLHDHVLIMNVAARADGTTGALDRRPLFQHRMTASALYRAELAAELTERLGLRVKHTEKGLFELLDVPEKLVSLFSKRRAEIERRLEESGLWGQQAAQRATLETRSKKEIKPRAVLFKLWREFAQNHGVSQQTQEGWFGKSKPAAPKQEAADAALSDALRAITTMESHFSQRELLQKTAEFAPQRALNADYLELFVDFAVMHNPEIKALGERRGELRYSTNEMLNLEREVIGAARRLAGDQQHPVSPSIHQGTLTAYPTLSSEQQRALRHLTIGTGRLALLTGFAGTGKTFLLNAAKASWQEAGFTVLGAAFSGKAADGLTQEAAIPSSTIHRLLLEIGRARERNRPPVMTNRTVLVLDEASMIPTRLMAQVMREIDEAGAKLALTGDHAQLQAIEAGAPYDGLLKRLPFLEMQDIIRQREAWARAAVKQFVAGEAEEALRPYAERGLVAIEQTPALAVDALVSAWSDAGGAANPSRHLIFANTRREVARLNQRCQEARRLLGTVDDRASVTVFDTRFFVGDRVLFTKNDYRLNVRNGFLGTISGLSPKDGVLTVQLDSGRSVSVPTHYYDHLSIGYAVTAYKGQGMSVENAYVLVGGPMQDREATYVQVSRSKSLTRFFTDELTAGADLSELVYEMTRSRKKELALDLLEEQEEGLAISLSLTRDMEE